MKNTYLIYLLTSVVLLGCGGDKKQAATEEKVDELRENARLNFMPLEASAKPDDPNNPKIVLGKKIFFEKGLSADNSTSCNSCHDVSKYGVDNLAFSPGAKGGSSKRNSPTILNTHMQVAQFWDGRVKTLREQIRMPIMTDGEMSMASEQSIVDALNRIDGYKEMFTSVYPGSNGINIEDMSDAVATYIESLVYPSKFDKYLTDNSFNLNQHELLGLKLFMEKGCTDCHQGRLLGGDSFEKFGVHDIYWKYTRGIDIDSGKYAVTGNVEDIFVFKVPSLRNVDKTYPYFHDGSVQQLEKAIQVMGKVQLDEEINAREASSIAEFLATLTSEIPARGEMTAGIR